MSEALMRMIANARAEWALESPDHTAAHRPPVASYFDEKERAPVPDDRPLVILDPETRLPKELVPDSATQSTQVGVPISAGLFRILTNNFGREYLIHRAVREVWNWCHLNHVKPERRSPDPLHFERGYICPYLVADVVAAKPGVWLAGIEESWLPKHLDAFYAHLIRHSAEESDLEYDEAAQLLEAALRHMDHKRTFWAAA